ncbi:MAG: hypothetical protein AB7S62_09175 [Azoarcus sp.]|jgi:hypothetical protein
MQRRHALLPVVCVSAVCLLLAGSTLSATRTSDAAPDFHATGVGPFLLMRPLLAAATDALRFDPAAAYVGPGCDARDQVSVHLKIGGRELSVMSMANADGRIEETLASPLAPLPRAGNAAACAALGADFAASLRERLGPFEPAVHIPQPVSDEFIYRFTDDARAVARWFSGGRTCDVALHFSAGNRR